MLVATAIVEQSLDLDFDLVDLRPGAGRAAAAASRALLAAPGRSATITRPAVGGRAAADRARPARRAAAAAAVPVVDGGLRRVAARPAPTGSCPAVTSYASPATCRRSSTPSTTIPDADHRRWKARGTARLGDEIAAASSCRGWSAIPGPRDIDSLCPLTDSDVDPELLATRFDADSVRVLPVFATADGQALARSGPARSRCPARTGPPEPARMPGDHRRTVPVRGGAWLKQATRHGAAPPDPGTATPPARPCAPPAASPRPDGASGPPRSAIGSSSWTKSSACALAKRLTAFSPQPTSTL